MTLICVECGKILTDEERHYYESRCESCEGDWANEIAEWREGGVNAKFDALYGGESPTIH